MTQCITPLKRNQIARMTIRQSQNKMLRQRQRKMIEQQYLKEQIEMHMKSLTEDKPEKGQIVNKLSRLLLNLETKLECSLQQTACFFQAIVSCQGGQFSNCLNNYLNKHTKQHTEIMLKRGLMQYVDGLIAQQKPEIKSNGICLLAQVVGSNRENRDKVIEMGKIQKIVEVSLNFPSQTYEALSILFEKMWKYCIDTIKMSSVVEIVQKFIPLLRSQHICLRLLLNGFQQLIRMRNNHIHTLLKRHNLFQQLLSLGRITTNTHELEEISLTLTYLVHFNPKGIQEVQQNFHCFWQYMRDGLSNFDSCLNRCRVDSYFNLSYVMTEGNQEMLKKIIVEWDLLDVISKCLLEEKGDMLLQVFKLTQNILELCDVDYLYSSIVESKLMDCFIQSVFGYKMMADHVLKTVFRIFRSIGHITALARQIDSSGIVREILQGEGSQEFQYYWEYLQLT